MCLFSDKVDLPESTCENVGRLFDPSGAAPVSASFDSQEDFVMGEFEVCLAESRLMIARRLPKELPCLEFSGVPLALTPMSNIHEERVNSM